MVPSIPLVWERVVEVRLSGAVGSQRGWLSSVSLHLTPYQPEMTEQTRQPSPPTCLHSPPCSISLMVWWAWGCRVWAAVCRMTIDGAEGQENWETRRLAWAPALLAQRHFRSVSAARHRPNVAKIAVSVKGQSLCVFLLTQTYINKRITHAGSKDQHKKTRKKRLHEYRKQGLIPSHPSSLSLLTLRAVKRGERPSNRPKEKADMDQRPWPGTGDNRLFRGRM